MNKSLKHSLFLLSMAVSTTVMSQDSIESETKINAEMKKMTNKTTQNLGRRGVDFTYFYHNVVDGVEGRRMAIVMEETLPPCKDATNPQPDTVWAEIRELDVGEKRFEMLSSVIMSAILADKKVGLMIVSDQCYSKRAQVYGAVLTKTNS